MVSFTAVCRDGGLLASTPKFLVVPREHINLVYLNLVYLDGARSFDIRRDLKYDRTRLKVTAVKANDVEKHLLRYTYNFPSTLFADILALSGDIRNTMRFGSVLLSIDSNVCGDTASLDYVGKAGRARMDVYTARRRTVDVAFRFVRYPDAAGQMTGGTTHTPSYAAELVEVMNRLYLPSANIELRLKSSEFASVPRQLGPGITTVAFRNHIVPLRDPGAELTAFFVGKFRGTTDPEGQAFRDVGCLVVDDAPYTYIAPQAVAWDGSKLSPVLLPEVELSRPQDRPRSDRDLHIVLAHEIAHLLGADHNDRPDNLMSMRRLDLKLDKETVRAISHT